MNLTRLIPGLAVVIVVLLLTMMDGGIFTEDSARLPEPPAPAPEEVPGIDGATSATVEPPSEPGSIAITGRVVSEGSRRPVAGAEIALERGETVVARTTSLRDGRFRLLGPSAASLPPDTPPLLLVVRHDGFAPLRAILQQEDPLRSGDVGDLFLRAGWTVRGTVRGEDGIPVDGAEIRFWDFPPDEQTERLTGTLREVGAFQTTEGDQNGHFVLSGVSARSVIISVVAPGFVTGRFAGSTRPDGERLDLRLRRGHTARVRVVDQDGDPVAGARVNLYPSYRSRFAGHYRLSHYLDRTAETDLEGRCLLTGLDERFYRVTAEAPDRPPAAAVRDPTPPPGSPPEPGPGPVGAPDRGAADSALFAGGPELVLVLRPDWKSYSNAYEDGPGEGASPPWGASPFAWVHSGPPRPNPTAPEPEVETPVSEEKAPPEPKPEPKVEKKPPPNRAWLRIRVLSANGVPMPNAYVRFEGPEREAEITEKDGTERFRLTPGTYRYTVSPMDFGTDAGDLEGTMELPGGVVTKVDLTMPEIWAVHVEVRDPEGSLMPRLRLQVLRGKKDKQAWTGDDGRAVLFAERGEPLSLLACPDGLPTTFRPRVEVPPNGPIVLHITPPGEITGRVLDPAGEPLFGVRMVARREGLEPFGPESWEAWTGDDGLFRISGPAVGSWRVTASHAAFSDTSVLVDLAAAAPLTLQLQPLLRLRGHLVDSRGEGIPGAVICIWKDLHGWVESDADGRFEIILPTGHTELGINVKHDEFLPRTVEVPARPEREMEFRMSRGVELTLNVRCRERQKFSVSFTERVSGMRIHPRGSTETLGEGEVVYHWPHAPAGAVRVRLKPRGKEEQVLDYTAEEGGRVVLDAEIP